MKTAPKQNCVQCHEEMLWHFHPQLQVGVAAYCQKAECPNYNLLQAFNFVPPLPLLPFVETEMPSSTTFCMHDDAVTCENCITENDL